MNKTSFISLNAVYNSFLKKLFKKELETECYLKIVLNGKYRSALANFRCCVATISKKLARMNT